MKTFQFTALAALLILFACGRQEIKEGLNKTGEVAGQALGEVAQGMQSGVSKAFEVNVTVSDHLQNKGIKTGQVLYGSDTSSTDNILTIYIMFDKTFKGELTAKVFNNRSLEMGRSKAYAAGETSEAKYIEFRFDQRTDIDNDCKIVLE